MVVRIGLQLVPPAGAQARRPELVSGHVGRPEVVQRRMGAVHDAQPETPDLQREVDVGIDKPDDRMAAGMTGELAFVVASKDRAAVAPRQALQGGKLYTVRDGRLAAVDGQVGLTSIERVEVLAGLDVGDRVVISPVAGLRAGQPVRTTFMDPTAAAGLNKPAPVAGAFKGFSG